MKKILITDNTRKKISLLVLLAIVLLGAFFRFYRIREYLMFLGDEGRDVLVVKRMIVDHKLTLLGPITSVGSMYMGPIYYYFMAPFLWLWKLDPVGPAIMVALFAIATILLIYLTADEFFNSTIGFLSALLYAVSPLPIIYGRASWNPNVVPFFSLLLVYSLLKVIVKKKYSWLVVVGFALGILLQLHYVTSMFLLIIPACLFLIRFRIPLINYLKGLLAFLIAYFPFLLFELRHGFVNIKAVFRFLAQQKAESATPLFFSMWRTFSDVFIRLFWRLIVVENAEITKIFLIFLIVALIGYRETLKKSFKGFLAFKIIFLWLIVGTFSFSLFRGVIYDYYFGSIFAAPFFFTGIFLWSLWKNSKETKILAFLIFSLLIFFNLKHSPLRIAPNNILENTKEIARFVYDQANGKPYNFALIAYKNSDHAYRYFLEVWGNPPVTIENPDNDPKRETVKDQLLVVCEEKVCQPLGHPLWEIAGFGRAEVKGEWQVSTAKVFYLTHYKDL